MILECFYAFMATLGFSIILHVRGSNVFFASLGGALGWAVYYLGKEHASEVLAYFLAALAVTLFSEIMAVVRKTLSTTFLIPGIIPLVPGGAVYRAMAAWLHSSDSSFFDLGTYALYVAGSMAIGILLGTVLGRMQRAARRNWKKMRQKVDEARNKIV